MTRHLFGNSARVGEFVRVALCGIIALSLTSTSFAAASVSPADFDGDGDVDQADFGHFQICISGVDVPQTDPTCASSDLDMDGDVDAIDVDYFEGCHSGPSVPAEIDCITLNQSPTVDPGNDSSVMLSDTLQLDGNVTDDGLPEASSLSTVWFMADGPGDVTFDDPSNPTTTASFSKAGEYTLSLTASDGQLSGTATIVVTVMSETTLEPMTTAVRTQGLAPFAVFFDAVNPGSNVVQPSDDRHSRLSYQWDFGDDPDATWATSGRPKNEATSFVAAHVYEQPGTYTVRLDVIDTNGQPHAYEQTIVVQGFSGTTYYTSNSSGSDNNNGLSPQQPFKTLGKAISMAGANVRLLFKRGDNWTVSSTLGIYDAGPGIIGAYANSDGSDDPNQPKPLFTQTSGVDFLRFGKYALDWRVCDVELVSQSNAAIGIHGFSVLQQNLLLRVDVTKFGAAFIWTVANHNHDQNFIVECTWKNTGGRGVYLGGHRSALLGNYGHDCGEHILRVWHSDKFVIGENILQDPPSEGKASLKLHNAPGMTDKTQYVVVSGNVFRGDQWPATFGPQNWDFEELVEKLVIERNIVTVQSNSRGLRGVCVFGPNITVRNNIFNGTGSQSSNYVAVRVEKRGVGPVPHNCEVYHNTVYRTDGPVTICELQDGVTINGTVVKNNLAAVSSNNLGQSTIVHGPATQQNNLLLAKDGLFTDPGSNGFVPQAGTAPIDSASSIVEISHDYSYWLRPLDGDNDGVAEPDIGAFERP